MDCNVIRVDLAGYHLSPDSLDDERRDAIDEHLVGCSDCLRAYLKLKRHLESTPRPSEAARKRLRDAVQARHQPRSIGRASRFLRRPVPLYQTFAAAAVVLLLAMLVPILLRSKIDRPTVAPTGGERVDTSRQSAESMNLY